MRRIRDFGALCLVGMAFLCGCGKTQAAHADSSSKATASQTQSAQEQNVIQFVKNPDAAPAFELNDLDGKPLSLAEAKGKIVLLNFWATWCGPCRAEVADLVDLQKRYADKLEIIALATDEDDPDEVRRFVQHSGINYRVAITPDEVRRMNAESCDCGCKLTLAQCRINDSACRVSLALTAKVVSQVAHSTGSPGGAAKNTVKPVPPNQR